MTKNEKREAIDYIRAQLENDYIDVGGVHYENEVEVIRQAMNVYIRLPEIIDKLKKEVYCIDDSATLSSRDVINEEDVFEALELLMH